MIVSDLLSGTSLCVSSSLRLTTLSPCRWNYESQLWLSGSLCLICTMCVHTRRSTQLVPIRHLSILLYDAQLRHRCSIPPSQQLCSMGISRVIECLFFAFLAVSCLPISTVFLSLNYLYVTVFLRNPVHKRLKK